MIAKTRKYIPNLDLEMLEEQMRVKYVKIFKLYGVSKSNTSMKEQLQDSVDLLTCTLHIINRAEPLICICL